MIKRIYMTLLAIVASVGMSWGATVNPLPGKFSVADGTVVYFSKGNLQYDIDNSKWQFAADQFTFIGNAAGNTSMTSGVIDLFGWGTGSNPTLSSTDYSDYSTFTDWGVNAISNGGNTANTWRTLTKDEWVYLFYTRTNAATLFGLGSVNGVNGTILLPDNWTLPEGASFTASTTQGLADQGSYYYNSNGNNFSHNTYTAEQWSVMESAGAVFLPAAGDRYGTDVDDVGSGGGYWSATPYGTSRAYDLNFGSRGLGPQDNNYRYDGLSVRLVTETAPAADPLADAAAVVALIDAIGEVTYPDSKDAIDAARAAYDALSDEAKALISTEELAKLTDAEAAWAALVEKIEHNVSYIGKDGELKNEIVALMNIPDAPDVNGYEFVQWNILSGELFDGITIRPTYTPIITTDPQAINGIVYNGTAQTLITAGVAKEGHIEYRIAGEETWSTELPQATTAGIYLIQYKLVREGHEDYLVPASVIAQIAKTTVTYTALTAVEDLTYNYEQQTLIAAGTTADGTFEYTLTPSETESWSIEFPQAINAGTYNVYFRVKGDSNHYDSIAPAPVAVTIDKAALTATAEYKTVTYGDEEPEYTITYAGWQGEDNTSVLQGELLFACEYTHASDVGEYAIIPSGQTAANYAITFVNGKVTVEKAALTVTAENKEVEYGEEAPVFTVTYEGWKNADDALVVSGLTLTSEYAVTSNVGTYAIVPANAEATNYAITFVNGTLTVNQAPLTITADNKEVEYGEEAPAFTASYSGWKNADDATVVSGLTFTSEYLVTSNVGTYAIVPANATATNYAISYVNGTLTVNQAPLTITAEDKYMFYGNEVPEFTATYAGWKNADDETVVSGLAYTCVYAPGSYIGTYAINPNSATAHDYAITFVDGTLTVEQASVIVSEAKIQIAKFEDGTTDAVVLDNGILNGVKLGDPIAHITTATFSDAAVGEHKVITVHYELTGDAALLNNYDLILTSEPYFEEGTIIENFVPDNNPDEQEDDEAEVKEGIEVYAYGYCDGSGYSLRYHLNSGNPDQYKIDFADSHFTDIDWTNLTTPGADGTIDIEIPVDLPTGDYSMTVTFRDSRFDWLESNPFIVTFHVNLPETYVKPMFDNTIILVDTCECFTDIQWYHRANSTEAWQPIEGATGHYYRPADGSKLTGEYFVKASMNGVPTYTCGQADMENLYGADNKQVNAIVKAFPNPVITTTNVTIENSENYEHNLRIVNLMGVEMQSTTFEGNETVVDMNGYVQGNYMISVDGIVVKVMKQ